MNRFGSSVPTLGQTDWNEFASGFRFPLRTILSFEFALMLLVSVGAWKKNPNFAWMFPIDASLVLTALCAVGIMKYLFTNGFPRRLATPVVLYGLFCVWTMASLIWTKAVSPMPIAAWISRVIVINGVVFFGALVVVAQSRARTIRFLAALGMVALILGVDYVIQARSLRSQLGQFEDIQYNLNGEIVALGFIVFFAFMLYTKMFTLRWTLCVLALCSLLYASLIIGSRQSFLAAMLQILVIMSFTVYVRNRSLQLYRGAMPAVVLLIVAAFGVLLLLQTGFESRLLSRLAGLTEYASGDTAADHSAGLRVRFMTAAIQYWSESPFTMLFGNGLFSFSTMYQGFYFLGTHPHNLFLNILTEFGLIGMFLFASLIGTVVLGRGLRLKNATPLNGILLGIATGEVFRAMVGIDIEGAATFLVSMCLVAALAAPSAAASRVTFGRDRSRAPAALSPLADPR